MPIGTGEDRVEVAGFQPRLAAGVEGNGLGIEFV